MMFTEAYGLVQYPGHVTAEFRQQYPAGSECEIPGCPADRRLLARLVYDHCHNCGLIRGILSGYCNRDLGRYERNIPLLGTGNTRFDKYLIRHHCQRGEVTA